MTPRTSVIGAGIRKASTGTIVLAMHMDGTNGSTVFTELTGKTVSATGNSQISTAQSKFGGASAYFDGNEDNLSTAYLTSDFNWWVSDFFIQVWVYPVDLSSFSYSSGLLLPALIGNGDPAGVYNYWSFGPCSDGKVRFYYWTGAGNAIASTEVVTPNAWNYICFKKQGSNISIGVNGIESTPTAVVGTPQSSTSVPLTIGRINGRSINGYVDDLLISKGGGRNVDVPTTAFISYRYWRLYITANVDGGTYTAIGEIELRGSVGGADLTTTSTPSDQSSYWGPNNSIASKAINNVIGAGVNAWVTSGVAPPHWVSFDLGSPMTVFEVAIAPENTLPGRSPKNFLIQGSNDNINWTTVKAVTNATGYVDGSYKIFQI